MGGTFLVGVEDDSRKVRGVLDVLKTAERLAHQIADSIRLQTIRDVEVLSWCKLNMVATKVYPNSACRHGSAALGTEFGTFVHVGSTYRKTDPT